MLQLRFIIRCERAIRRQIFALSTSVCNKFKVTILGGAGGVGQPLSLLLKQNRLVTELAIYDKAKSTPGIVMDLDHINTHPIVEGHTGDYGLCRALHCANIVVIPAGKTNRKPGLRKHLFKHNVKLMEKLVLACVRFCPCALMAIITNPVNIMVPLAHEIKQSCGICTPEKIFGVTTLDLVRASTFVGREFNVDPAGVNVPVIGGHSGPTIVPLLSQCRPLFCFSNAQIKNLTHKIKYAGGEVVQAKAGTGSATLSMAFAAARLINSLLRGLAGEKSVIDYAYVKSSITEASYFSSPLLLGEEGVSTILPYRQGSEYEKKLIEEAIPQLQEEIEIATKYLSNTK